jgi:hypothetical protein
VKEGYWTTKNDGTHALSQIDDNKTKQDYERDEMISNANPTYDLTFKLPLAPAPPGKGLIYKF